MSTYQEVVGAFSAAREYASNAAGQLNNFTNTLAGLNFTPASVSFDMGSVGTPPPVTIPAPPPNVEIDSIDTSGAPSASVGSAPSIQIDSFTDSAPNIVIPPAPTINYGAAPTIPSVANVQVPVAPSVDSVAKPSYLSLSSVPFANIDLHEDWLDKLEFVPELKLVEPTPYTYSPNPKYASELLDALKAKLLERMTSATGLDPAVEQAIWDRARSRETASALANEAEILRASEAFGFELPSGVLAAQLSEARQNYYDKLSELSRDVAIKQAELEQANLKDTIAQGMQLEAQLIDYAWKMEQLTFETSKVYAENAIQVHNAVVEQFRALLGAYQTYAQSYDTIIKGELAKVEVYKARLQGEQTKADINNALVQQYKAEVDAGLSRVEIYKAQVGAAQTLVQLEQAKIGASAEQIRAYTAKVNAEAAKVEAYKAGVQGAVAQAEIYKAKASAFSAKASAQGEKARAEVARYSAQAQAIQAEWEGYRAKVQAEAEMVKAQGIKASASTESYKAAAYAAEAEAKAGIAYFEAQARHYEASKLFALETAKINADSTNATNAARIDAAKAGAQVYAQLISSAYGIINAHASISGSSNNSVSYNYSGDVSGDVSPKT